MALYCLLICPFSMCQGSLELHVLSHVVLGPLSDVTHLTQNPRATITVQKTKATEEKLRKGLNFVQEGLKRYTKEIQQQTKSQAKAIQSELEDFGYQSRTRATKEDENLPSIPHIASGKNPPEAKMQSDAVKRSNMGDFDLKKNPRYKRKPVLFFFVHTRRHDAAA